MFPLQAVRFMTLRMLGCVFVSYASCAFGLGQMPGDVLDSGYFGRTGAGQDLYWLDATRVIFIGYETETEDQPQQQGRAARLVVWDTTTRRTVRYADLDNASWLCSHDRFVHYGVVRSGVRRYYVGEFSKERAIAQKVEAGQEQAIYSPLSCREYDPTELKRRYGSNLLPLLIAGEYLDRGITGSGAAMRYFPGDGRSPVSLADIPTSSVLPLPRYSAFLDSYVFQELRAATSTYTPYHVWLLHRSGAVTQTQIPPGPWLGGSVEAMPVTGGLVIKTRAAATDGSLGAAGIYVHDHAMPRRILAGMPYRIAVASDGCKVAVSVNSKWPKPSSLPRIMVVSLCRRGN